MFNESLFIKLFALFLFVLDRMHGNSTYQGSDQPYGVSRVLRT